MTKEALSSLLANKLVALALVVLGFLILSSSYRYGSFIGFLGGCLVLVIGIILMAVKIGRRNRPRHPE
ncbi:hypothetical protein [Mesorhizobium xinjiangense]|uniref:hypothetical protein n=1 Tax=Mesorhizobium xinjiangense TaxID=2678685 RepID=UPI0012EE8B74|nr:hypothetical protein [Mesorhizobium xinjiangense]